MAEETNFSRAKKALIAARVSEIAASDKDNQHIRISTVRGLDPFPRKNLESRISLKKTVLKGGGLHLEEGGRINAELEEMETALEDFSIAADLLGEQGWASSEHAAEKPRSPHVRKILQTAGISIPT